MLGDTASPSVPDSPPPEHEGREKERPLDHTELPESLELQGFDSPPTPFFSSWGGGEAGVVRAPASSSHPWGVEDGLLQPLQRRSVCPMAFGSAEAAVETAG